MSDFLGPYELDTIVTGDARELSKAIPDESIDLIIADPPYNVSKKGGRGGFRGKKFINDAWDVVDDYAAFSASWMSEARRILKANGTMYVWAYHRSLPLMPIHEWYVLNLITWHKTNAFPTTMQNSIWSPSCEYAYFVRKEAGKNHTFHIGKDDFARDFFEHPVINNGGHPTQKPLPIISEFVRRSSNPGDVVLDMFMGSGTTAVAAQSHGRRWLGFDVSAGIAERARERVRNVQLSASL